MCGYCCGGVPADRRGEGHKGCSAECYNAPGAARVARLMARAFDEGVLAMSRALQGGSEPVNPYRPLPPGGPDA